ncbi:formate dehydrogenase subunit gamma [Pseudoduganella flava]|jgi:formate dehydrogenase subunit gamma|uniref:Formate dehydrogenase subunit gamma n=1 Tax=Pseudoduganella flava TaxID=871742 RepID=A0A562PH21_9BURK|nr:formate dehydrogenase subunit gamma [Pseudoduganella flava]QGZ42600.1 formate dehydrogenase subunit gamma [Pseudoduganella flava]TWI43755.1 formate dehydrogenase subunit gamma [Pseudoduganella flava]
MARGDQKIKHDKDGNPLLDRYTPNERSNHWITAICFILLAVSGLALFHPATSWMAVFLGGGQWTRILHPFIGLVMFVSFMVMVIRFWHHNYLEPGDREWFTHLPDVLAHREDKLPRVGRYNAGQKVLFYVLILCMVGLLLTGIVMWRAYFSYLFPVGLIRLASLLHAVCAFGIIVSIIIHIYAGIWVKGSIGAMVRGTVTYGWARKHHPRWFEEEIRKTKG